MESDSSKEGGVEDEGMPREKEGGEGKVRDIFHGRDIPELFPRPEYFPEINNVSPDGIYTVKEFNYQNKQISFQKCRWLKPNGETAGIRAVFTE